MAKRKRLKKVTGIKWPGESGPGYHTVDYDTHVGRMPFRVLKSPYRTNADFNAAVDATAQHAIQPDLDEWERNRGIETQRHTGRAQDITSLYDTGSTARQNALTAASGALNNLITLNSGLSGATRDAMAAALRAGTDRENAVAQELGTAALPGNAQKYQDATQAKIDTGGIGLTGDFSGILGGLARDVGINEVGRGEASRNEESRWNDIMDALSGERRQIMGRLPGERETARQNLMQTELARQAQGTQQNLAERQFGEQVTQDKAQRALSRRQQAEAERQGRRQARQENRQATETERSNRANESINRDQIAATREANRRQAAAAGNDATRKELEAKAQRFDQGVKLISDYMTPTKQESGKKRIKKSYENRVTNGYDEMIFQLRSATGAGPIEVRRMILAAVNPSTPWGKRWVNRANKEITSFKDAQKNYGNRVHG